MNIISTKFEGLFVLEPTVFEDHRGFFMESYNSKLLSNHGINHSFVQDNQSKSTYGVLRGLHFQNPPYAQTKLIRALSGSILDAVVDIRKSSKTYGQSFSIELSAKNKKQLLVPQGFAHGFSVLSDTAEILYKCDSYYNKQSEGGLIYNDDAFGIDWGIPESKVILSEKDKLNIPFAEFNSKFD
ncbi:dTDP-4-dehydrorhamnose 3,5-epimerase [Fulvivirga lutimaris]|uniref:dTDP-4-dehydrorhamnose 3,5-epimerase n=1 Tax=Fulvivirga lutimaris TaxID=1819566 RepID=UPI0012BB96FB|nr:dTDP-4-dehydrorhamnose 3,5-epimerase [Fulvivirga lutimaris]MTI39311.1 dTDP-4-dehydrorhamnose 3,5-epimerase [Fulvivirga lutimaris]